MDISISLTSTRIISGADLLKTYDAPNNSITNAKIGGSTFVGQDVRSTNESESASESDTDGLGPLAVPAELSNASKKLRTRPRRSELGDDEIKALRAAGVTADSKRTDKRQLHDMKERIDENWEALSNGSKPRAFRGKRWPGAEHKSVRDMIDLQDRLYKCTSKMSAVDSRKEKARKWKDMMGDSTSQKKAVSEIRSFCTRRERSLQSDKGKGNRNSKAKGKGKEEKKEKEIRQSINTSPWNNVTQTGSSTESSAKITYQDDEDSWLNVGNDQRLIGPNLTKRD